MGFNQTNLSIPMRNDQISFRFHFFNNPHSSTRTTVFRESVQKVCPCRISIMFSEMYRNQKVQKFSSIKIVRLTERVSFHSQDSYTALARDNNNWSKVNFPKNAFTKVYIRSSSLIFKGFSDITPFPRINEMILEAFLTFLLIMRSNSSLALRFVKFFWEFKYKEGISWIIDRKRWRSLNCDFMIGFRPSGLLADLRNCPFKIRRAFPTVVSIALVSCRFTHRSGVSWTFNLTTTFYFIFLDFLTHGCGQTQSEIHQFPIMFWCR